MKILLIDDDQLVANIYRNKFSLDGFEVETALDGESGLDKIGKFRPDVVVLDLMLPKLPGLELLKQIRARPELQKLPVIVFSNTYLSNIIQDAWKAGASKCLSKASCTPKQLIAAARALLSPPPAGPPQPVDPTEPPVVVKESDADVAFQAELRQSFMDTLPGTLAATRASLQALAKNTGEAARVAQLKEMFQRIRAMTGNPGIAGMHVIAQMGDALEALLRELYEKPANINASTLRTIALAVDFLAVLFQNAGLAAAAGQLPLQTNILVVDDEAISRRAVCYALEKAKLKAVNAEDPEIALQMLAEKTFDLVFLDVNMPGMNGFELCTKLRAMHRNKNTPVVFVTSLTDFESRANSTISGGNDLIAKPFLFIELSVKALVYVLRGRLAK